MGIKDIRSLNQKIQQEQVKDLILTGEAFHGRRYAGIADRIAEHRDRIKLVLIAGPSSSGKLLRQKDRHTAEGVGHETRSAGDGQLLCQSGRYAA